MNAQRSCRPILTVLLTVSILITPLISVRAVRPQDPVTGAFTGRVSSAKGDTPIEGAKVEIINKATGFVHRRKTDSRGNWRQDLLPPGIYEIKVVAPGFDLGSVTRDLYATQANTVIPVPIVLNPTVAKQTSSTPTANATPTPPAVAQTPATQPSANPQLPSLLLNRSDGRRGGNFGAYEATAYPLGARTLIRSFDELTFLLPGVALPPQSVGNVQGPGVGAGLGTAGQFVVNGFSGRTHNFMVDGSDNNDEEVGVRRQGFMTPVPQTIESLSQYSVMTLLPPTPFGRNIGAQVNAISRRGEVDFHGTVYGFFNSSNLNARNFFDSANGLDRRQMIVGSNQPVVINTYAGDNAASGIVSTTPFMVQNQSGGKDSFTLGQFGAVLGGPLTPSRSAFFFLSVERQILNASEEQNFIVPTLEQRSIASSGATGLYRHPFTGANISANGGTRDGAAVFSLFPFPNNPAGVFGGNTYTTSLPNSGRGLVFSGRVDSDFRALGGDQSFAGRYNLTDDDRIIPTTGGALFSSVRPRTRTQNFSAYLNTTFGNEEKSRPAANQIRFSFGTTGLNFDEVRDPYLIPSGLFPNQPFLLNAPYIANITLPAAAGVPNTGQVTLARFPNAVAGGRRTTETALGPVGRVTVSGFSPVGVDVSSLPQSRDTKTLQIADVFSFPYRKRFYFTVGGDIRPIHLDSDLASNSRTELTFGNSLQCTPLPCSAFVSPLDTAAVGATSTARLSLARVSSQLNLRYTQFNVFGHTEFRLRPNLNIYLGLRYEYNSPIADANNRIESAYSDPNLALVPFLSRELAAKTSIFDADINNFSPRLGLVYSHSFFDDKVTIMRFGYGAYYDQILGAAVTRARNIFPNFVVANFPGGLSPGTSFNVFNPFNATIGGINVVQPGTLNTFNPNASLSSFVNALNTQFPGSGLDVYIPNYSASENDRIRTPVGNHLSAGIEQELSKNTVLTAAYVGTFGAYLLSPTTPFGGNNVTPVLTSLTISGTTPTLQGHIYSPRQRFTGFGTSAVPPGAIFSLGGVNFSRYDAAQFSLRGRLGRFAKGLNYNIAYTLSKATDENSDFVDTAHSASLPQCSFCSSEERSAFGVVGYFTRPGEFAPADYDSRHRFSYGLIYDLPGFNDKSSLVRAVFGNLQLSSIGEYQSGRPFTINTVNDVNVDGNLTDRPNTVSGIEVTGNGGQPVRLTTANTSSLLAPLFQNGAVERNSFRGGDYLNLSLAITKSFNLFGGHRLRFRTEIFNFLDRANFGMPERYIESPGFGRVSNTITPGRRIQFSLKYSF